MINNYCIIHCDFLAFGDDYFMLPQLHALMYVNSLRNDQFYPRDDTKVTVDSFLSLCFG